MLPWGLAEVRYYIEGAEKGRQEVLLAIPRADVDGVDMVAKVQKLESLPYAELLALVSDKGFVAVCSPGVLVVIPQTHMVDL